MKNRKSVLLLCLTILLVFAVILSMKIYNLKKR